MQQQLGTIGALFDRCRRRRRRPSAFIAPAERGSCKKRSAATTSGVWAAVAQEADVANAAAHRSAWTTDGRTDGRWAGRRTVDVCRLIRDAMTEALCEIRPALEQVY